MFFPGVISALKDGSLDLLTGNHDGVAWRASRCGRNEVWRIEADSIGTFFAKRHREHAEFVRELFGYTVAAEIARQTPEKFYVADVVFQDANEHVLVTRQIEGESLRTLVRNALRRDRNLLFRRSPRQSLCSALELLREWLTALHSVTESESVELEDHSVVGVRNRISRHLARLSMSNQADRRESAEPTLKHDVPPGPEGLVFSDVSLDNFFFHQGRVAAIDFEDLGWGRTERDAMVLRRSVLDAMENWKYWRDERVDRIVQVASGPLSRLVELELAVLRIPAARTSLAAENLAESNLLTPGVI